MTWTPANDLKPYYRNPRADVQPFLPKKFERMLDVGCGAGAFGLDCKSNFGAEVWGIEVVEDVAEYARQRLEQVFTGDALEVLPTLPEAHFDLVTFMDVLEHTAWPGQLLEATKRVLRPGGSIVASLPNLRYWEEFKRLAWNGDFPSEDSGIFDRTHLRFFTRKSLPRLFEEAGYKVDGVHGIHPTLSRKLALLNLFTAGRFSDCKYLQYVVNASPLTV